MPATGSWERGKKGEGFGEDTSWLEISTCATLLQVPGSSAPHSRTIPVSSKVELMAGAWDLRQRFCNSIFLHALARVGKRPPRMLSGGEEIKGLCD